MSVFDGNTLTTTHENTNINITTDTSLRRVDNQRIDWGFLKLTQIATVSALGTTNGVDCKTVWGDYWEEFGQSAPNADWPGFRSDVTTRIAGNETHKINPYMTAPRPTLGDLTVTVNGDVHFTVQPSGSYTETQFGPVNKTFFQDEADVHHADFHL